MMASAILKSIKRERARVDRGGFSFCVLIYNLSKTNQSEAVQKKMVSSISKAIRQTDEIGFIKKRYIGILLYDTSYDTACDIANKLSVLFTQFIDPPECRIYSYPNKSIAIKKSSSNFSAQNRESVSPNKSLNFLNDISDLVSKKVPWWKRFVDIIGSTFGLIFFSPIFIFVGILIKRVSPGPILFSQERVGYAGKKFTMYKFRTMHVNTSSSLHKIYVSSLIRDSNDEAGSGQAMKKLDGDNNHIIKYGRFLRKTCIDELPQLINVLFGEMSLVGPRPSIPYEVDHYLTWHNGRFDVLPGMTGLWQVNGKNKLTFKEMIRLDICYAHNLSIWTDLKILMKTPLIMIKD